MDKCSALKKSEIFTMTNVLNVIKETIKLKFKPLDYYYMTDLIKFSA